MTKNKRNFWTKSFGAIPTNSMARALIVLAFIPVVNRCLIFLCAANGITFATRSRRYPTASWEFDNIDRWVNQTGATLPSGTLPFRARPGFDATGPKVKPYSGVVDIGAPSKCAAGRVNEQDQRVLYCADQHATAISEVRPYRGELVSVCEIRLRTTVQIADLQHGLLSPNPFTTQSLRHELEIFKVLRRFAEQLARPLDRRDDEADYVPCRYLANRIRSAGLGGIRYGSAMQGKGSNVVLFDPAVGGTYPQSSVRVTDLTISYSAV